MNYLHCINDADNQIFLDDENQKQKKMNCVCMTVRFRVEQQLEILTQESDTESNASNPLMLVESKKSHLITTGL